VEGNGDRTGKRPDQRERLVSRSQQQTGGPPQTKKAVWNQQKVLLKTVNLWVREGGRSQASPKGSPKRSVYYPLRKKKKTKREWGFKKEE